MRIAIIGCGEVGGAYARALQGKATLLLCDIVSHGRPRTLSQELDLPLNAAPDDWLRECDFAIAAVPGRESAVAAASALPFLSQGSVYVDVSTGAPDSLRQSAGEFKSAGRSFVDTAILGAIDLTGGKTPVLIAGEEAERASEVFVLMGSPSKVLDGGTPGDAVALKLLRSVIIKNIECAAVESITAAEHLGVRDKLFEALGDVDNAPFADLLESLVTTHILHAERRMHEMEEAANQLRNLGFDAAVTGALEDRYRATQEGRKNMPPPDDAHETLDKSLEWLIAVGRKGSA
jgi:3-hydroxyisobutyrate dehydrogenase-like beta-hydroxyacid dehydrogenase